jgi:hypothetical protein
MTTNEGWVYLLRKKQYLANNDDVYKIGMTKNVTHFKAKNYRDAQIYKFDYVFDCIECERKLINCF